MALLVSGIAWAAAPGKLDRSFGHGGVVHLEMGGRDQARSVSIGSGRRIVLVGGTTTNDFTAGRFAVARLRPDGKPDRDFSGDGRAYARMGSYSYAWAGSIDAQHRVVAAGESCDGTVQRTCKFAVARFTRHGRLDRTFGDGGVITTAFPGGDAHARAVAVSHGRIYVAGVADDKLALARYRRDGLDTAFGNGGTKTVDIGADDGLGEGIAVDTRQRMFVASGNGEFAVTAFTRDGRLRRSFGKRGTTVASFRGDAAADSVTLDSRGRLVAAGYDAFRGRRRGLKRSAFAVARFDRDGGLDDSFSRNGKVETQLKEFAVGAGVDIDSRGRIVAAGQSNGGTALMRYRRNGRLDRSFGGDGKVRSDAINTYAVAIDSRNRIVVGGSNAVHRHGGLSPGGFAAARFAGYRHR